MPSPVRLDPFQRIVNVGWGGLLFPIFVINIKGSASHSLVSPTSVDPPAAPELDMLVTIAGDDFELRNNPKSPNDGTPVGQTVTALMLANLNLWSYPKYEDIEEETDFSPEIWFVGIGEVADGTNWAGAEGMPQPNPFGNPNTGEPGDVFSSSAAALAAGDAFRAANADVLVHLTPSIGKFIGELDIIASSQAAIFFASTSVENGLLSFLNLRKLANGNPTVSFSVTIDGPPVGSSNDTSQCLYDVLFLTSLGTNFPASAQNVPQWSQFPLDLEQFEVEHNTDHVLVNTRFDVVVNMADFTFSVTRHDT